MSTSEASVWVTVYDKDTTISCVSAQIQTEDGSSRYNILYSYCFYLKVYL